MRALSTLTLLLLAAAPALALAPAASATTPGFPGTIFVPGLVAVVPAVPGVTTTAPPATGTTTPTAPAAAPTTPVATPQPAMPTAPAATAAPTRIGQSTPALIVTPFVTLGFLPGVGVLAPAMVPGMAAVPASQLETPATTTAPAATAPAVTYPPTETTPTTVAPAVSPPPSQVAIAPGTGVVTGPAGGIVIGPAPPQERVAGSVERQITPPPVTGSATTPAPATTAVPETVAPAPSAVVRPAPGLVLVPTPGAPLPPPLPSTPAVSSAIPGIVVQPAPAIPTPPPTTPPPPSVLAGSRLSLNLREADVRQALDLIFQDSGASYVLEPGVSGTVNVSLNDVTREQALDAVVQASNLAYRRSGDVYYIGPRSSGAAVAPTTSTTTTVAPAEERTWGIIKVRYMHPADLAMLFGGTVAPSLWWPTPQAFVPPGGVGAGGVRPYSRNINVPGQTYAQPGTTGVTRVQ